MTVAFRMFTFVTGGLRSGKSEYALRRASEHGPPPWLYVAAHIEGDEELKAPARQSPPRPRHDLEADRGARQDDHGAGSGHAGGLRRRGDRPLHGLAVQATARRRRRAATATCLSEVEALADRLYRSPTPAVVVTTEIGLGFCPPTSPIRRLINVAGRPIRSCRSGPNRWC